MFKSQITAPRPIPDPAVPTYYWYRKNDKAPWFPVLVTPRSENWPAVANIAPHNPSVDELKGEWALCPFPTQADTPAVAPVIVVERDAQGGLTVSSDSRQVVNVIVLDPSELAHADVVLGDSEYLVSQANSVYAPDNVNPVLAQL